MALEKRKLYPSTPRLGRGVEQEWLITEKLDGSNLCFFKKDGILHIAQRNNIYTLGDMETDVDVQRIAYKGLMGWLRSFGTQLEEELHERSVICGEWLGMGKLKYEDLMSDDTRFYMFAKANINENGEMTGRSFNHGLFKYSFRGIGIPGYIRVVPVVDAMNHLPSREELDDLYEWYYKGRRVEGLVVTSSGKDATIYKYVRINGSGNLVEHSEHIRKSD